MTTSTAVPVTVTPEAAARIAQLGFGAQVERMIDYARRNLPELTRIEVVQNERYDLGGPPGVAIEAYSRYDSFDLTGHTRGQLAKWSVSEFAPEVLEHLLIDYLPEAPNAG